MLKHKILTKVIIGFATLVFTYLNIDESWIVLPGQSEYELTVVENIEYVRQGPISKKEGFFTIELSNIGKKALELEFFVQTKSSKPDFSHYEIRNIWSSKTKVSSVKPKYYWPYNNQFKFKVEKLLPSLSLKIFFPIPNDNTDYINSLKTSYSFIPEGEVSLYEQESPTKIFIKRLFLVFCLVFIPFAFGLMILEIIVRRLAY